MKMRSYKVKGIALSILLAVVLVVTTLLGCVAGDPLPEDLYTKDLFPGADSTYDVGSTTLAFAEGHFDAVFIGGVPAGGGAGIPATLFDATTFLYATVDDTPQPKTPTEVMAILSGTATASQSFDWNEAWVDNVERLRGNDTNNFDIYANYLTTAANERDIVFYALNSGINNWVEVFRVNANGASPALDLNMDLDLGVAKKVILNASYFDAGNAGLRLDTTGSPKGYHLRCTNPDDDGGRIFVERISVNPAANDKIVEFRMQGRNSVGGATEYGYWYVMIDNPTNGVEESSLHWDLMDGGAVIVDAMVLAGRGDLDLAGNGTFLGDLDAFDINAGNDLNCVNDLDVTDDADIGGDLVVTGTSTFDSPVSLTTTGKVYLELRPDLDFESVRANGKPTQITRGIVKGFSLPIYAANNEELFLESHTPTRWDNTSDILVHIHCYIDTANTGKNFNVELAWEHFTDDDIVPDTSNPVTIETATGTAAQYQSFHLNFTIDHDIDIGDPIISTDEMHFRVRRIDASSNEIAGEIVVTHIGVVYLIDKLGDLTP